MSKISFTESAFIKLYQVERKYIENENFQKRKYRKFYQDKHK